MGGGTHGEFCEDLPKARGGRKGRGGERTSAPGDRVRGGIDGVPLGCDEGDNLVEPLLRLRSHDLPQRCVDLWSDVDEERLEAGFASAACQPRARRTTLAL